VHTGTIDFQLGRSIKVRDGRDVTIITTGGMLQTGCDVADVLVLEGITTRVLSMHTVKPLDENAILAAAEETPFIFTLEEHSISGGLGGAVAEVIAEYGKPRVVFRRLGVPPCFSSYVGSQEYLRDQFGLSTAKVLATIRACMARDRSV
jgi:transketolase